MSGEASPQDRYVRQRTPLTFSDSDQAGIERATVTVVGAGGLGSPVLTYLALAGVGTLRVVDGDVVEMSNLNRQFLHGDGDLGSPKVESARCSLQALNGRTVIETVASRVDACTASECLVGSTLVVDCTDNEASRRFVGDWCREHGVPCVWGAVCGRSGYASSWTPEAGRTFASTFAPAGDTGLLLSPAHAGIIGAVAGVLGCIMAMEALEIAATGRGRLSGQLFTYDASIPSSSVLRL